MIKFPCPHCEINIDAEPQYAGAAANCPSCGGDLVVPAVASCEPESISTPGIIAGVPDETAGARSLSGGSVEDLSVTSGITSMPGAPDEITEVERSPGRSLGTVLSTFAKSAAHEMKLNSKIAVLKTRIESVKQIELRKAHYALGRKLFESRILLSMQDEIETLESQLSQKSERSIVEDNESKGAMLKRVGQNAAKCAESELLSLRLKQALTRLGELARNSPPQTSLPEIEAEMNLISIVESKIHALEEEAKSLMTPTQAGNLEGRSRQFKHSLAFGGGCAALLLVTIWSFYFSKTTTTPNAELEANMSSIFNDRKSVKSDVFGLQGGMSKLETEKVLGKEYQTDWNSPVFKAVLPNYNVVYHEPPASFTMPEVSSIVLVFLNDRLQSVTYLFKTAKCFISSRRGSDEVDILGAMAYEDWEYKSYLILSGRSKFPGRPSFLRDIKEALFQNYDDITVLENDLLNEDNVRDFQIMEDSDFQLVAAAASSSMCVKFVSYINERKSSFSQAKWDANQQGRISSTRNIDEYFYIEFIFKDSYLEGRSYSDGITSSLKQQAEAEAKNRSEQLNMERDRKAQEVEILKKRLQQSF